MTTRLALALKAGAALLALSFAGTATAEPPIPAAVTTLPQALALAYRDDPQLLAARSAARAADHRLPAARALYGPTLDVEAGHGYQSDRINEGGDLAYTQHGWSSTAEAVVTQPVTTFGRVHAAEEGARAQIANAQDTLRLTEAQTLQNVINAYVAVRRDQALVTISEENLALLQKEYDDSSERFRYHAITLTDLQQVETRLEEGRAGLIEARAQLGTSRAGFIASVGAAPGDLAEPAPLPVRFATLGEAEDFADLHSPQIRAAQSREKVSRANVYAARAEFAPQVDLRGTVASNPLEPYYNSFRDKEVRGEVVVSWRLFDSGLRAAQLDDARETNDADWHLIDAAVRQAHADVAGSWEELAATRDSLGHYGAAVAAAQKAYDGAVLQERAGARTTLDVLNLARDLLDARTSYVSTVANEYLAQAGLLSAVGELEAPMLLDVPAYDPQQHLRDVESHGDVPVLTPLVRALDGVGAPSVRADRPARDSAPAMDVSAPYPQMPPAPAHEDAEVAPADR